MARISMKTLREMSREDIDDRLQEARSEYARLKTDASKGTLRKNSGKMRPLRRDIARIKTRLSEMKRE